MELWCQQKINLNVIVSEFYIFKLNVVWYIFYCISLTEMQLNGWKQNLTRIAFNFVPFSIQFSKFSFNSHALTRDSRLGRTKEHQLTYLQRR